MLLQAISQPQSACLRHEHVGSRYEATTRTRVGVTRTNRAREATADEGKSCDQTVGERT